MHTIEIINEQNKINDTESLEKLIEDAVINTLDYEKVLCPCEISVTIIDNDKIKQLNKAFRNIDRETDVLSFPSGEYDKDSLSPCFLGDIALSLEKAEEQKLLYGHAIAREVAFLTAHSVLHLLGYDHMNEDEEKRMFAKQEEILQKMGLKR